MNAHVNTVHQSRRAIRLRTRRLVPIHPSGDNRATRRAQVSRERHAPFQEKHGKADDMLEVRKEGIKARVIRKQNASHEKAVARREAAKGIKPSLTKRAKAGIQAALKRRADRKRQVEAHARKVARQQAKAQK